MAKRTANLKGDRYGDAARKMIVYWGNNGDVLTLDNLEISDWANGQATGGIYAATGSITMRNLYIHDGSNGVLSGTATPRFL